MACFAVLVLEYCLLLRFSAHGKDIQPILSGSPQFTLLTLIVGLAAYLRSIRANAVELRDKIRQGEVNHYPIHNTRFTFAKEKMELLDEIANSMSIAGPFFICLMAIVGFRIARETFLKLVGIDSQCNQWLFMADSIIVSLILMGLISLAVAHFSARGKDEEIRIAARKAEVEAIHFSLNKDVKEPPSGS